MNCFYCCWLLFLLQKMHKYRNFSRVCVWESYGASQTFASLAQCGIAKLFFRGVVPVCTCSCSWCKFMLLHNLYSTLWDQILSVFANLVGMKKNSWFDVCISPIYSKIELSFFPFLGQWWFIHVFFFMSLAHFSVCPLDCRFPYWFLGVLCLYFKYQSFVSFVCCKYLLPVCGFLFLCFSWFFF